MNEAIHRSCDLFEYKFCYSVIDAYDCSQKSATKTVEIAAKENTFSLERYPFQK